MATGRFSQADLVAMIPLYLDGELGDAERAAVEAYLAEHPEAVAEFAQAARLIDLLDETITPQPCDDSFVADVMLAVRRLTPAQRWWQRLSLTPPLTALRWGFEWALLAVLAVLLWQHPWAPAVSPVECRLLAENDWLLGRPVAVRVLLRERGHDRPLAGARVRLGLQQGHRRVPLRELRTNEQGTIDTGLVLPNELAPGPAMLGAWVDSAWGDTAASLAVTLQRRALYRVDPASARLPAGCDLVARLSGVDAGSGRPLAGEKVPWRLVGRGASLAAGEVTLSEFGWALLRVPTSRYLSPQDLELRVGEEPRTVRRVTLTAPCGDELTCRVETAERYVVAGGVLHGMAEAGSAAGLAAAGAAVDVELRVGGKLAATAGSLDEAGRWDFVLPVPDFAADALAILSVRVRSLEARSGWAETRLPAAPDPVRLELDPGAAMLVAGLDNPLAFRASRPDGSPLLANIEAWFNDQRATLWTDSQGRAALSVQPRPGGNRLVLRADVNGQRVERAFGLTAREARAALAVQTMPVGDSRSAYVTVRATDSLSGPAYLDLLADGRAVASRSLSLSRGSGGLVMEVPRGLSGRLLVRAYTPQGRGGWRTGFALLDVAPEADLRLTMAREEEKDTVDLRAEDSAGQPRRAQLLLCATPRGMAAPASTTSLSRAPAVDGPVASAAPLATANSYQQAREQALARQRAYFRRAPWVGATVGLLLLLSALTWLLQTFSDPYEYVAHDERRPWGRVPQVHRRGVWAGYGLLAVALAVALLVAGGLALAGHQARQLADAAVAPEADWFPRLALPDDLLSADGRPSLDHFLPAGAGGWSLVTTDDSGRAHWPWPAHSGLWQVRAEARTAEGQGLLAESLLPARPELAIDLEAPARLTQGDRLAVPLTLRNPLDLATPVVVTATVDNGLDLAAAPTQRLTLPRGGRLRLSVPVVAVEAGRAKITVRAQCADLSAKVEHTIDVVAPGRLVTACRLGSVDETATVRLDVPAGTISRRVDLRLSADPLAPLDGALAACLRRPVFTADEAAAQTEAAALRLQLAGEAQRISEAQRQDRLADVRRSAQRLLTYEAHDGQGQATGGYAPGPGLPPSKLLTARVLLALRAAHAQAPVDPAVMQRITRWLGSKQQAGSGLWLPEGPAIGLEQSDSGLRTAALVTEALVGAESLAGERAKAAVAQLAERSAAASDSYTLVAVARALQVHDRAEEARPLLGKLVNLRDERPEGALWYPGPRPVAAGATGRGAVVETTAQVVRALVTARLAEAVSRQAADWLRHQVQPDGTWGSVRATVESARALAAVDPPGAAARGKVRVSLGDQTLAQGTFDDADDTVEVAAAPRPGEQTLTLTFQGRGRPAWFSCLATTSAQTDAEPSGFGAACTIDRPNAAPGDVVTATLRVRNTGTQPVPAVVAALPVPAGFAPAEPAPTLDGDILRVPVGTLAPDQVAEVSVRLRARAAAASITPAPATIEAAYDPSRTQTVAVPNITVG